MERLTARTSKSFQKYPYIKVDTVITIYCKHYRIVNFILMKYIHEEKKNITSSLSLPRMQMISQEEWSREFDRNIKLDSVMVSSGTASF